MVPTLKNFSYYHYKYILRTWNESLEMHNDYVADFKNIELI